ncbi:hypothetical protein T492DRAFT_846640 [Pavlovales sp. CCMP2436]|nr:hypothetical protein T492DRAFT_846640 [Pavlovales sp. CCMP2436]
MPNAHGPAAVAAAAAAAPQPPNHRRPCVAPTAPAATLQDHSWRMERAEPSKADYPPLHRRGYTSREASPQRRTAEAERLSRSPHACSPPFARTEGADARPTVVQVPAARGRALSPPARYRAHARTADGGGARSRSPSSGAPYARRLAGTHPQPAAFADCERAAVSAAASAGAVAASASQRAALHSSARHPLRSGVHDGGGGRSHREPAVDFGHDAAPGFHPGSSSSSGAPSKHCSAPMLWPTPLCDTLAPALPLAIDWLPHRFSRTLEYDGASDVIDSKMTIVLKIHTVFTGPQSMTALVKRCEQSCVRTHAFAPRHSR